MFRVLHICGAFPYPPPPRYGERGKRSMRGLVCSSSNATARHEQRLQNYFTLEFGLNCSAVNGEADRD